MTPPARPPASREDPALEPLGPLPIASPRRLAEMTGAEVLIAEDNDVSREILELTLMKFGLVVTPARNGAEALDLWRQGRQRVVFLDCQMPKVDGYTVAGTIRAEEEADETIRRTWIIGITAYALSGDQQRCLQSGMDEYLTKPIRPDRLAAALDYAFEDIAARS